MREQQWREIEVTAKAGTGELARKVDLVNTRFNNLMLVKSEGDRHIFLGKYKYSQKSLHTLSPVAGRIIESE